jgi:glycosyltransferase involved in cell wall biosynthesis
MKVVLEVQSVCTPIPTGIAWYTINLVDNLLSRAKHEYALAFFDKGKERGNREKYVDKFFGKHNPQLFECNTESFKVVNTSENAYKTNSYNDYTGAVGDVFHFMLPLWMPGRLTGEMVVTIHDLIAALYPDLSLSEENARNCAIGFDLIRQKKPICIADSLSTKADICNNSDISPDNVFVVPLAHDPKTFFPDKDENVLYELGIDGPYILFAGTVDDPRKGVADIITAFESIAFNHDGLKLVLAGDYGHRRGWERIKDKLDNSSIRERIVLTGFVTVKQLRSLMSGAMVFLFPSEYEGFGLPVLEAMACGSPVITANVSSLPEVGGDAVVYVEPNKPEQLAFEIERLLNSEGLRNEYTLKGFEQTRKFTWNKTAQMTEEAYTVAYERRQ